MFVLKIIIVWIHSAVAQWGRGLEVPYENYENAREEILVKGDQSGRGSSFVWSALKDIA